ncbi:DUF1631 family protein, partial [Marinimicrobium sp. UBA4509]
MTDPRHSGAGASAPDSLNDPQVVQHLKHARSLMMDYAQRVLPVFWREWCARLEDYAERARSNKEQMALYEYKRMIEASQHELEEDIGQRLSNGFVKFKNRMLNTLTGEERFSGDMLALVEHSDLEETIAITSITHRADSFFAGQLWALQQRLALLNGGEKIDERSNPVSPVQFCEALRKALLNITLDNKTKIIGYKTFDKEVIGALDELYEELNKYFIEENLLPNLRYTALVDDSPQGAEPSEQPDAGEEVPMKDGVPQRRASDRLLSGTATPADTQYQAGLYNAIRLLQNHIAHQVAPTGGA